MQELIRRLEILAETTELWIKDIKSGKDENSAIEDVKEILLSLIYFFFDENTKSTYKSK